MSADLRVATYNIHRGTGVDGRLDLERVADVLDRTDADVVGLQEVDRRYRAATEYADQLAVLGERLGMEAAFGPALERDPDDVPGDRPGQYGVAVLSRYPLEGSSVVSLPHGDDGEPRVLLRTDIEIEGGRTFEFCSTHLGLSPSSRTSQARAILDALDPSDGLVLVGDFNATPDGRPIRTIAERLEDAFAGRDEADAPTFPTPYVTPGEGGRHTVSVPDRRIDYVFHTPDVATTNVDVVESLASDHSLVVADLAVSSPGSSRGV